MRGNNDDPSHLIPRPLPLTLPLAVGLMASPALGGFLLERIGFEALTVAWALMLLVVGLILARVR